MSVIYDSLKKGHKIAITGKINDHCRNQLISNNWEIDFEKTVALIKWYMRGFYFVSLALENTTTEEKEQFEEILENKIIQGINSFRAQEPTMNQIYRYVKVCCELEVEPERIEKNEYIWKETTKLEKILEEKDNLKGVK